VVLVLQEDGVILSEATIRSLPRIGSGLSLLWGGRDEQELPCERQLQMFAGFLRSTSLGEWDRSYTQHLPCTNETSEERWYDKDAKGK